MGILPTSKAEEQTTATPSKRRSVQTDFSKLGPLKAGGTVGFSAFRDSDQTLPRKPTEKKGRTLQGDSDDDDDDVSEVPDKVEDVKPDNAHLSVEDAERQGELAEGLRKVKVGSQPLNRKWAQETDGSTSSNDNTLPNP